MKKIILLFGLLAAITGNAFAVSTLTEASATGTTIKFTAKLSEKLTTGYKVKVDLQNGKALAAMSCSASTLICTLSSNALPKGVDDASYSVGIYDSKGVLQGDTIDGSYVITSSAEVTTVPSSATGYSKISNSGATLPDTAKLGTGTTDWACTKDTKTGLIWEVKTTDYGLRDYQNSYTWYEPDAKKNGGNAGHQNSGNCKGSQCDTYAFTNAVNANGLCGKKDWRMPTVAELMKLVVCSDGKYDADGSCTNWETVIRPTINTTYFPDITDNYWFWSSSPYAGSSDGAWYVGFSGGSSDGSYKYGSYGVRLVRG